MPRESVSLSTRPRLRTNAHAPCIREIPTFEITRDWQKQKKIDRNEVKIANGKMKLKKISSDFLPHLSEIAVADDQSNHKSPGATIGRTTTKTACQYKSFQYNLKMSVTALT